MTSQIIVEQNASLTQIACLVDGVLREFTIHDTVQINEGDIFLGKITKKIITANSRSGYFVNIGGNDVFLNAQERALEDLQASEGQSVILQITQEPRAEKDARASRFLTFAGRCLVYCPYGEGIEISAKIRDAVKIDELRDVLYEIAADDGWIVRTAAAQASPKDILAEAETLRQLFAQTINLAKTSAAPAILHQKPSPLAEIIERYASTSPAIITNSHRLVNQLSGLSAAFARHPFADYGISEQLTDALSPEVKLSGFGRIFIEETHAFTAIDVDSGSGSAQGSLTALNQQAAREIARQIILRNLSGKIIIDFAGFTEFKFLKPIVDILERALYSDPLKSRVLGVSKAGNVEIIRQRRRPSLRDLLTVECSTCLGSGRCEK
ncbi:MAG: ribonuclease E/G [Alphaproteobacteria bacterium]|nr:ribonuclease E/G [Alphaproteobacteria bacterium]